MDFHLVHAQGQGRHKALFLLIVQPDQVAVVGVGNAVHRIDDIFQLLFGGRGMHQKDCNHEHLFIMVLQILQQFFRFLPEGHKVRGKNVHVKAGAHRPFLLVNFGLIQVTQLPFDGLERGPLVERLCVDTDDLAALYIKKCVQQRVIQFGGLDLQKGNRADRRANAEVSALLE